MKALRIFFISVLSIVLLCGSAYGAGYAVRHLDNQADLAPSSSDLPPADPTDPTEAPVVEPSEPAETPALQLDVRALQHRLFQLGWLPERTTGRYDAATKAAVIGFQKKRGLKASGVVDERTWGRLVKMTRTPTHDEKFNILKPGPTLLGPGATGDEIRDLQARLKQIQWYFALVNGRYDATTVEAVRGFQAKRAIPVTGNVDQRTLDRLTAMTTTPSYNEKHNVAPKSGSTTAPLDPACKTGRALCVDKSSQTLRWVVEGKVLVTYEVRFGSDELPTREGHFSVLRKSRDHVSTLYHTSMPFAMFFSGGQAVHYSPDFAADGYNGHSHGCVNVRDYYGMVWLFDQVNVGDKVIVYWS